jgi:hypothetical protein
VICIINIADLDNDVSLVVVVVAFAVGTDCHSCDIYEVFLN